MDFHGLCVNYCFLYNYCILDILVWSAFREALPHKKRMNFWESSKGKFFTPRNNENTQRELHTNTPKTKSLHLTECFSTYIHVCGVCDKYQVWAKVTALWIMPTFILSFSFYGSRFKNNWVSHSQVRCWRSLVGVAYNKRKYWELILPRFCPPAGNQIVCKGGLQKCPFGRPLLVVLGTMGSVNLDEFLERIKIRRGKRSFPIQQIWLQSFCILNGQFSFKFGHTG